MGDNFQRFRGSVSRAENRLLDGDPEGALALLATLPPQAEEIGAMQGTPFIRDLIRILAQDQTGQLQDRAGALARYTDRYGNDPLGIASLQASLGDPDAAFDTLSRLYGTSGEVWGANLNSPYLEPLHDDPRWTALTDRILDVPEDMEALINEVLSE